MAKNPDITHARLKEVLHYDPETGIFTWLQATSDKIKPGDDAGGIGGPGYLYIGLDNISRPVHRWAWFYMTGAWPQNQVDHINCDKLDNRWSNLREATQAGNNRNRNLRRANTSGRRGVYWHAAAKKWAASIHNNGRTIHLGLFTEIDEAAKARQDAELLYYGEFAYHD
jgi:hypothetical protein